MDALRNAILDHGLFEYEIKPAELLFAILQGVGGYLAAVQLTDSTDWKALATGAVLAALRPAIAIIFGKNPAP